MTRRLKRWENLLWLSVPGAITLLFLLFYLVPKYIGGLDGFMPLLPIIPVFYWGMYKADEMPYWFVFALGLVMDVISGAPLGLTSLLYMFFLGVLHTQHKYIHKEGFVIQWGYFAALLLLVTVLEWVFMALLAGHAQPVIAPLIQWLLTLACYPLLHRFFDGVRDTVSSRRWLLMHGR